MTSIATFLLWAIAYWAFAYYRRVLAPAVLMPLIWGAMLLLHPFFQMTVLPDLFDLRFSTILAFVFANASFCLGCFIYSRFRELSVHRNKTPSSDPITNSQLPVVGILLRVFLIAISVLGIPMFIQQAIKIFIASGAEDFLMGVRHEMSYGEVDLGPLKYLINFSVLVYSICQVESLRRPSSINKFITLLALTAAIVYAVFSTGRTYFVIILMLFLGLRTMLQSGFRIKKLWWVAPALIMVFTLYGLVYNKGGSLDSTLNENLRSASENTAIYFAASLNAFDVETQPPFEPAGNGLNTFRFFYVIGQSLGLVQVPKDKLELVQEYTFVPYETNVYTVLSPYVRDFGHVFAMIVLFLYGWLHTWLYHMAIRTRRFNYVIYYSLLLFPLVMSFFQDQYMSLLSIWIQSVFVIEIFLLLNKMVVVRRKSAIEVGLSNQ